MKINKDHFIGTENALRSDIRDYSSVGMTSYNYGLLPYSEGTSSLDLLLKKDQFQDLVVNLRICKAITEGGVIIDIGEEHQNDEVFRIPLETIAEKFRGNDKVYIFLNIHLFEREAYGKPDPDEDPPRSPFTIPRCHITIGTKNERAFPYRDGASQLTIGRLIFQGDSPQLDEQGYIPPCTSIQSRAELKKAFEYWSAVLDRLIDNGKKTLKKIYETEDKVILTVSGDNARKEISVAGVCLLFTQAMLTGLADILPAFKNTLREQPPIFTLSALQSLARKIDTNSLFLRGDGINLLINYLNEMLGIKDVTNELESFIGFQYDHENIKGAVYAINNFLDLLDRVFDAQKGLPNKDFSWKEKIGEITVSDRVENKNTQA